MNEFQLQITAIQLEIAEIEDLFFSHTVENVLEFCPNIGFALSKSQEMKSWIRPCFYGNHQ